MTVAALAVVPRLNFSAASTVMFRPAFPSHSIFWPLSLFGKFRCAFGLFRFGEPMTAKRVATRFPFIFGVIVGGVASFRVPSLGRRRLVHKDAV